MARMSMRRTVQGWTPLHRVLEKHNTFEDVTRVVQLLVERGAGCEHNKQGP
jgi:hypothetical protein